MAVLKRVIAGLALTLLLLGSAAAVDSTQQLAFFPTEQEAQRSGCGPPPPDNSFAADPAALAGAWLPELERLDAAIPVLSPTEQRWLDGELGADDLFRRARAFGSREYALQRTKLNVSSLIKALRIVAEKRALPDQTRAWLIFAYALIEVDSDSRLARLVSEQVVPQEALPRWWTALAKGDALQGAIRGMRTLLAQHVLICTLPAVLSVQIP